jgi:hypothetical protein
MIKYLFILIFFVTSLIKLSAQKYGNEWINFSQKHYKISIPSTGLYRIDSLTLSNFGIPLNLINPKNFQLFIKGKEQHIFINGESDNVFNTNDYIEFYAEKNDCGFDSAAYYNINRLPNPYYALFNDTNYAYLTWNNLTTNNRMTIETDISFLGYTPANYYYSERVHTANAYYSYGQTIYPSITDPRYVTGEGFGIALAKGGISTTAFSNFKVYQSSSLPVYIRASFSGTSQDYVSASFDHEIKLEYLNNLGSYVSLNDTTFFGYQQIFIQKQITSNLLQNTSHLKLTSVNNPLFATITNNTNLHYLYLKYPQIPDFNGTSEQIIFVDDDVIASKTFLDITNVSVGSSSVIFYDLTNHKYISSQVTGSNVKILVPNSTAQKKCFLTTTANVIHVNSLSPANVTGYFVNYKTANPDSAFLIISHNGLQASANDYKIYRQGVSGGSNHVIHANIDELYEQFAYGNNKNPLAIKNFCRYLSDSLTVPPKYLLLLGKSISNNLVKTSIPHWNACAIPTMGVPSSDNLLTCGIHGANSITPFIPIGRVSAKNNTELTWYLNKVVAHESSLANHDEWRKTVLHFAGGTNISEQTLFQSNLKVYEDIIVDTLFGGKVYNFKKISSAPIQITVSDSVKDLINKGTSIITFFGHASISGFDQAIDDPNVYNNIGKYPLMIANSCYSGNIHTIESNSTSEAFTLINQKGSIGFLASSSTGVVGPLHLFTTELYRAIGVETYYKGIGDAVKNTCYKNSFFPDQLREIGCLEMTLEGDPSIKINAFAKPDYEIKNSSVFFNTSSYVDSIGINIHIKNLGKAIRDTFFIRVERYFATGDSITFLKKVKAPYNQDTVSFFIIKDFENGIGLNKFKVFIDSYNEISELSETNNSTTGTVDLFIQGGDVVPVYPYKYAIIPKTPTITLKASTADPFAISTNYIIQLDTNDRFISPINSTSINSIGGLIEWTVNLPFADSTVYFWRISKDSTTITDKLNWRESSFQVIGTKTGWSQAHFHQFKNDTYQFVKFKRATRNFVFENDIKSLECNDGFMPYVTFDHINYKVNSSLEDYYSCAPDGWSFAVFDSISVKAWETFTITPPAAGIFGNCLCVNYPLKAFMFGAGNFCGFPSWKPEIETFLNSIPVNSKVLAWTINHHHSEIYPNSLYNAFESIGAANIRTTHDTLPYIIFGKKGGAIGSAHEVIGATNRSIIKLEDTLKTRWSNGYIVSEKIGPSAKWNSLHWKQTPVELPNNDSIAIKVVGIKFNGIIDTLATFNYTQTDILDLYNYVDASVYPYIKLVAQMRDNIFITPPQLKKWQVIYDQAPECAINPKRGYASLNDTLQEGDKVTIKLPIENLGVLPFNDSLVVTYWIEDHNRIAHQLPQKLKLPPFVSTQVIIDTINVNSYEYPGLNYLWVDVNPPANSKYQIEQYHFNNIARIPFLVNTDKINPLLDVTFDGTHILNGDIVSAKPMVLITLKDENKFLALNDTSNFAVYVKFPNTSSEKRIYFANLLRFTPAQLPSNSCKIEWMPNLTQDGKYFLRVQATDRAKNSSGAVDYNIGFEVVNKQTVTEVLNYPNPFSTSTRFVFTLTGSEVPDKFIIQIMTITGKVVREITHNELGNIHIGRNITDYAWDGKDDFGDKLANGVYLYRVITRLNGEAVEKEQTQADSFFRKGIGKMVIMR